MENNDSTTSECSCTCGCLGRNWKWLVLLLLLICVGLFVYFVTEGALVKAWLADRSIKTSEPFQMALENIRDDAEVVKQLGETLEPTGQASGEVRTETDNGKSLSGNANFYFDLTGPKGTANVHCQGKKIDGKWGLSTLTVTFADGSRHSVEVSDADDSLEDAPPWSP